ncbi:hypothetical protein G2W53_024141 [Senna tora]|uniref:Uncharacterized protein n=1 Tax=Senna tora TaxID=362788 RepID=A0A834TCM1_9FABA|nr:hypothetical protein G2W53_024141 [Senna tora]
MLNFAAMWDVYGKHISEIMQLGLGVNSSNTFSTASSNMFIASKKLTAMPSEGSISIFSQPLGQSEDGVPGIGKPSLVGLDMLVLCICRCILHQDKICITCV